MRVLAEYDDRKLKAALEHLERAMAHPEPAYADIGEHLLRTTRDRFDSQTDPEGNAWRELSPAYAKRKPRNADRILTLAGYLGAQLHYDAGDEGLELGSSLIYAAVHQFGWEERGIPARAYLGISGDDADAVLDMLEDHALAALS